MALPQTAYPSTDTFMTSRVSMVKGLSNDLAGRGPRHLHHSSHTIYLPNRSRLQETRLAPPSSGQSVAVNSSGFPLPSVNLDEAVRQAAPHTNTKSDSYIPLTVSPAANAYYQRFKDSTLNDRIESVNEALHQRTMNPGSRNHFGRCGSGWQNVTAYRDYGGHNCMFVDGLVSERAAMFDRVKQQYLKAYVHSVWPEPKLTNEDYETWPECTLHNPRSPLVGEAFGMLPPEKRPEFTVRAQATNGHQSRRREVQPTGSYSVDMDRIPSAGLRSGRPRSSISRYTWRETTEM